MSIYVGIDQALQKIGICVIDHDRVFTDRLVPAKILKGAWRLQDLRDKVATYLAPFIGHITLAATESQSYNSTGLIDQLGQIIGVLHVLLTDLHTPLITVAPTSLKKFVTGNGGATKEQMARVSEKLWGISCNSDDEIDAHGLAQIAKAYVEDIFITRSQCEVVHTLKHPQKKKRIVPKRKVLC